MAHFFQHHTAYNCCRSRSVFFFTPNGSTRQLARHPGIYGHRVSSSCECIRVVQVPCLQIVEKKKQCGIIPAHRTNQCNKLWWNEIYIKSEMGSFWSSRSRITGMPLVDWIKIRPFLKQHFKVENFGVEQNMLNVVGTKQKVNARPLIPVAPHIFFPILHNFSPTNCSGTNIFILPRQITKPRLLICVTQATIK